MELTLLKSIRADLVARALQSTTAVLPDSIEAAHAELQAQYNLQIGTHVSLAARRDAVAGLIDASLPKDVPEQLSDSSVIAVFGDLIRTGLIELEVTWVDEMPRP